MDIKVFLRMFEHVMLDPLPNELPSRKNIDHVINLEPRAKPIVVPYREMIFEELEKPKR